MYIQFSQSPEIEILILLLLVIIFPLLTPCIEPELLNVVPVSLDINILESSLVQVMEYGSQLTLE